jgi:anthraniloyl-CoA monooxygenase
MAVGAISEADHANSIIAAGRADLCAVGPPAPGRPGLDAARGASWHSRAVEWPRPYLSGRDQLYREISNKIARCRPSRVTGY